MFDIGEWIYSIFGSNEWGLLLCIFLIFLIDALVFPTLPELFFVLAFMNDQSLLFGAELLFVAVVAEIIGVLGLYLVVSRIRVPSRIQKIVGKYVGFLALGDERLILLNRVAPMIPFCGAFISIMGWSIKRSLLYVVIGCVVKYGIIAIMCDFFYSYYSGPDAQTYTIIFILLVIVISFILSFVVKKKRMPEA